MRSKDEDEIQGFWLRQNDDAYKSESGDEGYLLVGAIVAIFLVLLALSVAAPKVARQLEHERELEAQHRGNDYVRAIRVFYRKNGNRYPTSVEQLENTNNQRFLRQKWIDPLTGKDDWRIIHVGENKTTVKGFFGEDLPGLAGGLGAASGMASSIGNSTTGTSTFTNGLSVNGINPANGAGVSNALQSGTGGTTAVGGSTGSGSSSSTTGSSGSSSFGSSSIGAPTGGGGPMMGIGTSKTGDAMVAQNGEDTFEMWEFLYDPRIEQMYQKASLFGGGITSGAPTSGGLGAVPTGIPGDTTNKTGTPTPPPPQ
jgi:hypothetical protein